ncbi:MAG: adenylate/guanylate cyclase domain-containing protein, partial [Planctomycetota bacterium]
QHSMSEANQGRPEESAIIFRIGLHLGDLIVDGDDLYGDGVNVAARLEAEAPAGGIVISRTVHEAVMGRLKASFEDLGSLALKNIERPIQALRVSWDATDWKVVASRTAAPAIGAGSPSQDAPLALPDKPSIAVLPFQNMSGDPEQEYFADGMVEDIITALSRFKSLFVIARNSSFTYKGRAVGIKQIGRELGVRYVLEGSVRKAANKVRITGQLIDSETGVHLWADRFDGSLEDIFELQDQVTTSVVGAIAPKLNQAEIERARRKPVESLDAYDCYLRGLAYLNVVSKDAEEAASRLFYRAIDLDPDFVTPYGMAARSYSMRKAQGWGADEEREERKVKRLAAHVAAVGQDDAVALCWAGHALVFVCRDYDAGASMIDQGLAINQNLALGWVNRSWVSLWLGEYEEAQKQLARAFRLSPIDPETYRSEAIIALIHLIQGRYKEALRWATKSTARQPIFVHPIRTLIAANVFVGNLDEARKFTGRILEINPGTRISGLKDLRSFRNPEEISRLIEGLRLAGMPE